MSGPLGHEDPHCGFEDVAFWEMAVSAARRVVVVPEAMEVSVRREVEIRGLEHLFKVTSNQWLPEGKAFIFDEDLLLRNLCVDPETPVFEAEKFGVDHDWLCEGEQCMCALRRTFTDTIGEALRRNQRAARVIGGLGA